MFSKYSFLITYNYKFNNIIWEWWIIVICKRFSKPEEFNTRNLIIKNILIENKLSIDTKIAISIKSINKISKAHWREDNTFKD